ncbi:hypothetical protein KY290_024878 [Solanum tuberosum]|uniref:CCHC-type domain-containing protein n=1 Tax=Solanum tuberosum TaxID=4113 RepID=A0ABQ7US11_SOLTU|nr:hypothetical protein KY284_023731 [Solanum tuberosum]KAH0754608.1 hypothetical protein KY290_024878 [Solanum tuberosum]
MHIAEKEKLSFVCGSTQPPTEKDEGYEKWYTNNEKVKRSLSSYYGELVEIFCELDHRDKVIMENEKDVSSYRKSIQRQRVHIFLAGLDVNGDLEKSKAATMVSKYRSNQNRFSQNQLDRMKSKGFNKSTYKCTHCDQPGHTKDRCFEIVGYPEWWDHNRDSRRRNASKSSTTAIVETNAKEDVVGQSTALVATRGNYGKALNSSALVSNSTWIIDFGATDHMTFDSRQVSSLKPSS